jgi:hypothetical protein
VLAPEAELDGDKLARAKVVSQTFEQIEPTTYSADLVVTFGRRPDCAVILEVQRARERRKLRSWPLYVAHLWARFGCPVFLLVFAPSRKLAEWCAKPIRLGHPGLVLQPIVAGPESVPRIRSADEAMRNPALAVVSAVAHAREPDALAYAVPAAEAILLRDTDSGYLFYDLIVRALRASDANILEQMMQKAQRFASPTLQRSYEKGLEKGIEKGLEKGMEKGLEQGMERGLEQGLERGMEKGAQAARVEAILRVLSARNMSVPVELEQRIRGSHDMAELDRWLDLAATAGAIDELMEE